MFGVFLSTHSFITSFTLWLLDYSLDLFDSVHYFKYCFPINLISSIYKKINVFFLFFLIYVIVFQNIYKYMYTSWYVQAEHEGFKAPLIWKIPEPILVNLIPMMWTWGKLQAYMHVIRKCLHASSWSRSNKWPTLVTEWEYILIGVVISTGVSNDA